ncbi:nuclear transport factor 2 family protein [soil metagenome]
MTIAHIENGATTTAEQEIRDLIEARAEAIRAKNAQEVLRVIAPDIVLYDALESLQRVGPAETIEKTTEWLSWYEGPIGFEIQDMVVTANNDIGFAHYLYRVSGTMANGTAVDMWVRSTMGLRRAQGQWQVTHEHTSVPFDPETGKALLTATP